MDGPSCRILAEPVEQPAVSPPQPCDPQPCLDTRDPDRAIEQVQPS